MRCSHWSTCRRQNRPDMSPTKNICRAHLSVRYRRRQIDQCEQRIRNITHLLTRLHIADKIICRADMSVRFCRRRNTTSVDSALNSTDMKIKNNSPVADEPGEAFVQYTML